MVTVPPFKMQNIETVPTYIMHKMKTVPTLEMHNIGTVPSSKTHNVATQIFYDTLLRLNLECMTAAVVFLITETF